MWSAIIKAVDGAAGRLQKGMSAGIDVANSQHGGAAPASGQVDASSENKDNSGNGKTGGAANIIKNVIDKVGVGGSKEKPTDAESAGTGEGITEAVSTILSDENAKTSKTVGESIRAYGANASQGFANAGAIATGSKAAEWKDIDNSFAKKAAEDIVKGWRKKDFNSDSTNK